jgi:hypothetical protein
LTLPPPWCYPRVGALRLTRTTLAPTKPKNRWPGLWLHDGGTLTADTASRIARASIAVEATTHSHALRIEGLAFDDCHTGIRAKTAAPTQIHKNRFVNCYHGIDMILNASTATCTLADNAFTQSGPTGAPVFGITATGPGYTGNLQILNNRFSDLHAGIELRNVGGTTKLVSGNRISRLTDRLNDPALLPVGIRVEATVPCNVVDNLVMGLPGNPGGARGLLLVNSQAVAANCNRFAGVGIGVEVSDDCLNSVLANNVFRQCSTGVQLSPNGVLGTQGTPTTSNNNVWSQCQVGLRSVEADGRLSPFVVPPAGNSQLLGNPGYFTNPADGSTLAETLEPTNSPFECTFSGSFCQVPIESCSTCTPQQAACGQPVGYTPVWPMGLRDSVGTEFYGYWLVASGTLAFPAFDPEARYGAQAWLYAELRHKPWCRQHYPELDSFCTARQNTDLHTLQLVDERLTAGDTLTARLLNDGVVPENLPQANHQAFNALYIDLLSARAHAAAQRHRRLQAALVFDTLDTTAAFRLPAVPFGLDEPAWPITPEQLVTLRALANQCPLAGGLAVYRARALRTHFDGHATAYPDNCLDTQEPDPYRKAAEPRTAEKQTTDPPTATLYPNPARDQVTVQYRHLNAGAWLEVLSLTGQTVARLKLPESNGQQTLATATWTPGLYLCRIHNPGAPAPQKTLKLLITR